MFQTNIFKGHLGVVYCIVCQPIAGGMDTFVPANKGEQAFNHISAFRTIKKINEKK